jgi:mannose-6-phosphate isomerase-like protein (cupin superfamily)
MLHSTVSNLFFGDQTMVGGVLVGLIFLSVAMIQPGAADEPGKTQRAEAVDLQLDKLVQHSEQSKKVEFPWGWIRWVMNADVDPKAEMTFGIVHVKAGQTNPVHIHGNCEEILYMVSGSCEHKIGDKAVVLKAGDVIRIPRGVTHSARTFDKEPMQAIIVYNAGRRDFQVVEE